MSQPLGIISKLGRPPLRQRSDTASYTMMRKGLSYIEILVAMCDRVFDTTEAAGAFLSTPNHRIANTTPMHFVRDIPTLQRCIDLMPADPKLTDLNGKTYKRIW